MIIGYTNGYFDLLHVGHISTLQKAAALCDRLIVGVISDEECQNRKGRTPIIPLDQRLEIIDGLECVSIAVPVLWDDKVEEWHKYKFIKLFVGADHQHERIWCYLNTQYKKIFQVIYLPYIKEISDTIIKERIISEAAQKKTTVP